MEQQSVAKSQSLDPASPEGVQAPVQTDPSPRGSARQLARIRKLFEALLPGYQGRASIRLWDGTRVAGKTSAPTTVVLRQPAVIRRLLVSRDILALGEAFLAGDIDIEGPIEGAFDLVDYLDDHSPGWSARWRAAWRALGLPVRYHAPGTRGLRARRSARRNSRASIGHHYDVSNDFYRLWLDPEMVYSCAYFREPAQTLEAAQRDKLDYVCRKLRLRPGQHLLDIGCGWGALIRHAATHYGVQAHGITLSGQQYDYARARVRDEGLDDQVTVDLCDYRNLPRETRFDRIVSIGMFEHVGIRNFPTYFETVKGLLRPGGLFLNHGITNDSGWLDTPITRFVNRYVFPDGELTRVSEVSSALERAGFEILDVEDLRPHYAMTCRRWVRRLEQASEQARALTNEMIYRIWRLYMAGAGYYFQQGSLRVYQALVCHSGEPWPVPLRRNDLYMP